MKDIKTAYGQGVAEEGSVDVGLKDVSLTVRNLGDTGRRLGLFTRNGNAIVGKQVHHADLLHNPKQVLDLPVGYSSGLEVNVSAKKNYVKVFDLAGIPLAQIGFTEKYNEFLPFNGRLNSGLEEQFKFKANGPDLKRTRMSLETGDFAIGDDSGYLASRRFVSFTMIFSGRNYHIGLDLGKHPAVVTAELNYVLDRIHPNLRGFVAISAIDWDTDPNFNLASYSIYLAAPETLDIVIPLTTFPVNAGSSPYQNYSRGGLNFPAKHLNKDLTSAQLIRGDTKVETTSTVATVNPSAVYSTPVAMLATPVVIDLTSFTHEAATPTIYKGKVTIPASAFKTMSDDHRLTLAMLKLNRQYVLGRVFTIKSIKYLDDNDIPLAYENALADIHVMSNHFGDFDDDQAFPSVLIDEMTSESAEELVGYHAEKASDIQFAEFGGMNEVEAGAYLLISPRPVEDAHTTNFFRDTTLPTRLEIVYELLDIEMVPPIAIDPLGVLDYHSIMTSDPAFLPLTLTAKGITDWDITYHLKSDPATKYNVSSHEDDVPAKTRKYITNGTVSNRELVKTIPSTGIQFKDNKYQITRSFAGDAELGINLLPTQVVTSVAVVLGASTYQTNFPTVDLVGSFYPNEFVFIAGQLDGNILLKGKFDYAKHPVNVLTHATNFDYTFTVNGVPATRPTDFTIDKATGEWEGSFKMSELVGPGPGLHSLRVTMNVKYPWMFDNQSGVAQSATWAYTVNPSVEGIENDVTFTTNKIFNQLSTSITGTLEIRDLDSGTVLAKGNTLDELKANALLVGLVDIDFIYGEKKAQNEISCDGALESANLNMSGGWDFELEDAFKGSAANLFELSKLMSAEKLALTSPDFKERLGSPRIYDGIIPDETVVEVKLFTYDNAALNIADTATYTGPWENFVNGTAMGEIQWVNVAGALTAKPVAKNKPYFIEMLFRGFNELFVFGEYLDEYAPEIFVTENGIVAVFTILETEIYPSTVVFKNFEQVDDLQYNFPLFYGSFTIDGVVHNADKSLHASDIESLVGIINSWSSSSGAAYIQNASSKVLVDVIFSPSEQQKQYTDAYSYENYNSSAVKLPNGDFKFTLGIDE